MSTLRILLADDHEVVRRGLRALLEAKPGWEVVGEAATGREAVEMAKQLKPEVAILDISMPELNGLDATGQILKEIPQMEVLVLTVHDSEQMVREVLYSGARGYVLKSDAGRDLLAAVEALSHHKSFFSADVAHMVLQGYLQARPPASPDSAPSRLTSREREVVQLLAEGNSNKEVATALGISAKTAETHRANIMQKLGIHSLPGLVRYAVRNKIVES